MAMLAELVDGVIGVDTHRDTHSAAAVTNLGGVLATTTTSADAAGYRQLLGFADRHLPGRRLWAVEGAGSFGAGLTVALQQHGERVVEVGRPKRPASRSGAKATRWTPSGPPARRWARTARPSRAAAASGRPCGRCWVPGAARPPPAWPPPGSSRRWSSAPPRSCAPSCAAVPPAARSTTAPACGRGRAGRFQHQATVRALRATAQRIEFLAAEAEQLQAELTVLVGAVAPWLLEVPGVGPLSAAQVLVSWSHAGRFRSEAAFAALAGVNPIPASSGQVTRYRLM
jgi:hypothetical protein